MPLSCWRPTFSLLACVLAPPQAEADLLNPFPFFPLKATCEVARYPSFFFFVLWGWEKGLLLFLLHLQSEISLWKPTSLSLFIMAHGCNCPLYAFILCKGYHKKRKTLISNQPKKGTRVVSFGVRNWISRLIPCAFGLFILFTANCSAKNNRKPFSGTLKSFYESELPLITVLCTGNAEWWLTEIVLCN